MNESGSDILGPAIEPVATDGRSDAAEFQAAQLHPSQLVPQPLVSDATAELAPEDRPATDGPKAISRADVERVMRMRLNVPVIR